MISLRKKRWNRDKKGKKKEMKRTFAILLATLMLLSLLSGCANKPAATTPPAADTASDANKTETPADEPVDEPAEAPADEPVEEPAAPAEITYPLTDEPVTFSLLANSMITGSIPEINSDLNNVLAVQKISEITCVYIDWEMPGDITTTLSLMYVSEDYTDGLMTMSNSVGQSLDYLVEEEILYDLTDIIKESCPNYYQLISANDQVRREVTTDGGRLATMTKIREKRDECYQGYYVIDSVLEEAGFSATNLPVTYEDLEKILVAGQDDATNAPLYLDHGVMMAGYDVNFTFCHNGDNQLKYGYASENFKQYLAMLSDWYSRGLIDRDFATRITFFLDPGLMMAGDVIAFPGVFTFRQLFENAGKSVTSIPWPKLNEGDLRYQSGGVVPLIAGPDSLMIFTACEDPVMLAQWCDFGYSEEGAIIANFGVEGESYELDADGNFVYPLNDWDPDLCSYNSMMPFHIKSWREYIGEAPVVTEDRAKWEKDWAPIPHTFDGSLTSEESEEVSAMMSDIQTYANEYMLGVIVGSRSLDEWDEYVAYLNSLGLEECTAVYQAAQDRFWAR